MNHFDETRATTFDTFPWFADEALLRWTVDHLQCYGTSLLDVGTGTGLILPFYKSVFSRVVCVERSDAMLLRLKDRAMTCDAIIVQGRAESLPFLAESFDIVFSKSSLHHMNPGEAFPEMRRVAKRCVAVMEVIAPSSEAIGFLKDLLTTKERGRPADTVFDEMSLTRLFSGARRCAVLHYDQYINVDMWLDGSGVSDTLKQDIMTIIRRQPESVAEAMQIHTRDGQTMMLRRMALAIGVLHE